MLNFWNFHSVSLGKNSNFSSRGSIKDNIAARLSIGTSGTLCGLDSDPGSTGKILDELELELCEMTASLRESFSGTFLGSCL